MAETVGPSRVLLDDFTITVSPTEYALSTVQAGEVRDIAEELVEAAFEAYDWGPGTIYQYMGFTRVESVSFYNEGYSVIRVKGGIVSFDGSSQVVPSHVEIQTMISEIIDPSGGGGGGLTEALQATLDFSYVEETIYDVLWEPTPAPSIVQETTPPPTLVMTTPQTEAPTTNTPLVSVPVDSGGPRAIDNNTSTSSQGGGLLPAIIGVVAGLVLLAIAISLLVVKRRKRARQVWRQDGVHRVYHVESDLEQQAVKSDGVAVHSETGSSRLGRLFLSSTASTAGRGVFGSGEVTPPQSSDCSTDDDDFSGFDDSKVISVEPIIIPIKDDMNDSDGTQVVQTEVNLEKNIAALVALQIASQQEMKQRKEPEVVAEEGVLFVQSNADDCCINPLSYCGEYEAACLEPVGRRENAEENHSVDAAADLNIEKEVQVSEEAPLPEMKQIEDTTCAENDEKVPSFETKEETVEVDHVDGSQEDENDSDSAKPILNDETAPLPDASNESNVDSQEDATDIVVQVEDGCASQDNSSEEQEYAAEQDVDLMAIVDGIDGDSDAAIDDDDDDDSKTNTVEEYVAVEVVDRDPINEEGCREVDFEMQVNVEPPEENEPREEERESHETSTRKFFIMSPPASDTRTCGPYNRWSDVSSENSQERQAMSDDDQHEFKPDESWDWDDSTDVVDESFYTPSTLRLNDTMPLLGNSDSFGTQKQVASDETSGSDRTSSDIQESESDATPRDPFRTASGLPANDEEPLLSRLLGTYKLDKVTSSAGDLDSSKDSQERRPRSRSSPPHTKRCTVHLD